MGSSLFVFMHPQRCRETQTNHEKYKAMSRRTSHFDKMMISDINNNTLFCKTYVQASQTEKAQLRCTFLNNYLEHTKICT